nr:hypothetical protein [Streptomyces sp. HF10]
MESSRVRRSDRTAVFRSPSRAAVAFRVSTPSRFISASVHGLSLMVSIRTTMSRQDSATSSSNSDTPAKPGMRPGAPSTTRSRGSSRPSANQVSAAGATSTFTTDAGTTG